MSTVALLAIAVLTPTIAQPLPLEWTQTPTGQTAALLWAIDSSGGATWTVGARDAGRDGFQPLTLRRTRTGWTATEQPLKRGRLDDVLVKAPNDVWAVGAGLGRPHAQHWDGRRWRAVPGPVPPAGGGGDLITVAAARRGGGIWVSGGEVTAAGEVRQVVYRYRGGAWSPQTDAVSDGFVWIYDLAPIADDDVWAALHRGIAHYDGRHWTRLDLPGDDSRMIVESLAVAGRNDIWAAGHWQDPALIRRPLLLHFDGNGWTEVPTPADSAQLHDITLVGGELLAVGEEFGPGTPYVLRRIAGRYQRVGGPPGAGGLSGVTTDGRRIWTAGVAELPADPAIPPDPYVAVAAMTSSRKR